ncbi:olfactory receptor 52M1-like [Macrochelys suwanniensis]
MQETLFYFRVGHLLPYSMSDSNTTDFTNPSTFILLGVPGLETAHVWISIPFCTMYTIVILGNFTILFIVKREPSLHEPMYYFLCMLALTDLLQTTSTLPKTLSIFWFNSREIDFSACLTQMYLIQCFPTMASGIVVAMAFDRYVAVCHPLRHSTILTNPVVATIGLAAGLRGGVLILPFPFLARQRPYCRTNIVPHTQCEHLAVVKLACADTRVSSYYGLFVVFMVMGLDMCFITVSYIQILRAIFRLPTKDSRLKTFRTCISHLCVILVFCIPALFSFLSHRIGQNVPLHFNVLMANIYLLDAKQEQKAWYDEHARERSFKVGDQVMVLKVPQANKMEASWDGPFKVQEHMGAVNYLFDSPNPNLKPKVFHVNSLKPFYSQEFKVLQFSAQERDNAEWPEGVYYEGESDGGVEECTRYLPKTCR